MMSEGVYMQHKFYTKKEAIDKVKEILTVWESKGWSKPNDVPPNDENIQEFLQLMEGLGHHVDYKYKDKLKEVV